MIARIAGYRGEPEYVALHWDPKLRAWVPVRGDRGRHGEMYKSMAIALCVGALQRQLAPAIDDARKLHTLCDRRGKESGIIRKRQIRELARKVSATLETVGVNLSRLLDAPTANDEVDIAAEFDITEPATPDRAFLHYVSGAFGYTHIVTGGPVTTAGIEDALAFLGRGLEDRSKPANGNSVNGTGGDHNNGGDDA